MDFRPISLSNSLFKLFEKIIYKRLEWWAQNTGVLPNIQFGFRRARSTSDNIAILNADILAALESKQICAAVFVDIKVAFDSVDPIVLINKLRLLGLPSKIADFIGFLVSK